MILSAPAKNWWGQTDSAYYNHPIIPPDILCYPKSRNQTKNNHGKCKGCNNNFDSDDFRSLRFVWYANTYLGLEDLRRNLKKVVLVVKTLRNSGIQTNPIGLAAGCKNTKTEFMLENIVGTETVSNAREIPYITPYLLQDIKCAIQLRRVWASANQLST